MVRYSDETLAKLNLIESTMAMVIKKETGATVEVTIRDNWIAFYSEDMSLKGEVMELLGKVDSIGRVISDYYYEADEDGPESYNVKYESLEKEQKSAPAQLLPAFDYQPCLPGFESLKVTVQAPLL